MDKTLYFLDSPSDFEDLLKLESYSKVFVLVDENTTKHCYPKLKTSLPKHQVIHIKSGEIYKNLNTCQQIWQYLTDFEADRKAVLLNLGGGVIGDMGGFCASTYKRGIDFIQIPTTLLAQVDASVGGKLGIDFRGFKNHIGLFCEPQSVLISPNFLETLSKKQFFSGLAELIKHALIADKAHFEELLELYQKSKNKQAFYTDLNKRLKLFIQRSVKTKQGIVSKDMKEGGLRKMLNFGHTIGHAIESFYLHTESPLLHGEAIAVGIICESFLSFKKQYISGSDLEGISSLILELYAKINISESDIDDIIKLSVQDKKNERGKLKFSLLEQVGQGNFNQEVPEKWIKESLNYYISRNA